jgi:REP element-mobilizing transposase RayT
MARPLRIQFENALYHVTGRGNERKTIFRTTTDYQKFKEYLRQAQDKYGFLLHAYTLMQNHYHLILQTPSANLGQIMHYVNGSYTTYFNVKRKRAGHLFQGRYKAILVERDRYLLELSRYLHLNPVRAQIVERPEDYTYSSYQSYIAPKPEGMVYRDQILGAISDDRERAAQRYKQFVEDALEKMVDNPLKKVFGGMLLGTDQFRENVLKHIHKGNTLGKEVSHRKAFRSADYEFMLGQISSYFRVKLKDLLNGKGDKRNLAVYLLKTHSGLTNRHIGEIFGGISYSAVTRVWERLKEKAKGDQALALWLNDLNKILSNVKG